MADATVQTGYSEVNGIKMYYEIHGEGEPLVLIHGGGSTITTSFGKILPLLAKHFKTIAPELQAHGRTSDRHTPVTFEQDADDVVALLRHLQIDKASILGFSNGGNVAIQIANRHPLVVDKLILASTFYRRDGMIPGLLEGMAEATIDMMPQALRDAFLQVNPDQTKLLIMFDKDRDRGLKFTDLNDEVLTSIKAPTLIIHGDRDVITTNHAVKMSTLISNARLMIFPSTHGGYMGVAEGPDPDEETLEFTAHIIKNFINNIMT